MLAPDRDVGQDLLQYREQVVDFGLGAVNAVGILHADVGGAQQHLTQVGEDDAGAPVRRLEVQHRIAERVAQPVMVDHQVRALRPADHALVDAHRCVDAVDPGAGGVHHDARGDAQGLVGRGVAQRDTFGTDALRGDVGQRLRLRCVAQRVQDQFQVDAFRMRDPAIPVFRRGGDAARQPRHGRERGIAAQHAMPRHGAFPPAKPVVQREADAHEHRAPAPGLHRPAEEARHRRQRPAPQVIQRHHGAQRSDQVRRVAQQAVAFGGTLAHQREVGGFQVAQPAMHHARQGR